MMRRALIAMTVLSGATLLTAVPAAAQDGGGSCGGNLVEYVPLVVDGQQVGQLQLYYNSQNGNNCAVMLHGGPSWGALRDTGVQLAKSNTRGGAYQSAAYQRGNYRYQAGPVRTEGRGKCVYADAGMDWNGRRHYLRTGAHCG